MSPIVRVEIVVDVVQLDVVTALIDASGAGGYTIVHDVRGKGHRGIRAGDQVVDVMKNVMILCACSEEQSKVIATKLKPLLKRFGGICLLSQAMHVDH
jgi:hypothetical protein